MSVISRREFPLKCGQVGDDVLLVSAFLHVFDDVLHDLEESGASSFLKMVAAAGNVIKVSG